MVRICVRTVTMADSLSFSNWVTTWYPLAAYSYFSAYLTRDEWVSDPSSERSG
jgi:hypothetical protein